MSVQNSSNLHTTYTSKTNKLSCNSPQISNLPVWNSIQPGDHYDVRKSMMTNLSGNNKFMGDNVQIILLFQAAEIERLTDCLQDYKTKMRQISIKELDRHSYQTQIKELSNAFNESKRLEVQNSKLKDYIRKQAIQLDSSSKIVNNSNDLSYRSRYQSSLKQIQVMIQEKNKYVMEFNNISNKLNSEKLMLQRQLKLLRQQNITNIPNIPNITNIPNIPNISGNRFSQTGGFIRSVSTNNLKSIESSDKSKLTINYDKRIEQYQVIVGKLNTQIQRLTNLSNSKDSDQKQISQFINKINLLNQQIQKQQISYQQLTNKYQVIVQQKRTIYQQLCTLQSKHAQLQITTSQNTQIEIQKAAHQIQQLQSTIQSRNIQIQQLNSKRKLLQQQFQAFRSESKISIEMLNIKIDQMTKTIDHQSQQEIQSQGHTKQKQQLLEENKRLKQNFKLSTVQIQKINSQLIEFRKNILQLNHENDELKIQAETFKNIKQKVIEYENRLLLLSQQLERLNRTLISKDNQINNLTHQINISKSSTNQQYKNQSLQIEQYHQIIQQYQSNNINLNNEIIHLNQQLQISNKQSINFVKRINQYQGLNQTIHNLNDRINKLINQNNVLTSDIKTAQQKIIASSNQFNLIKSENDRLRIVTGQNRNKLKQQYQNHIHQLSEEIERINMIAQMKDQQNRKLLQQSEKQKGRINILLKQIQQNKITIGQFLQNSRVLGEYQGHIEILTSDLQRLTHNIESKNIQYQQLYNETIKIKQIQQQTYQQNQILKDKLNISQSIAQKNQQYKEQIVILSKQLERLNLILNQQFNSSQNSEMTISQQQLKLNQSFQQIDQLKRKLNQLAQSNRKIHEYQIITRQLKQQNQHINRVLKQKSLNSTRVQNDFNDLQSRLKIISQQNQQLKRRGKQILSLTQTVTQYEQRSTTFSQQINRLNNLLESKNSILQKQDLDKRHLIQKLQSFNVLIQQYEIKLNEMNKIQNMIPQYEQKVVSLSTEIQRLNLIVNDKIQIIYKNQTQLTSMTMKSNQINLQNEQLKRRLVEMKQLNIKIEQYNMKIMSTTHEITRLNHEVQQRNIELKHLRTEIQANTLRQQQYKKQISKLRTQFKQINNLKNTKHEYQHRMVVLSDEIERLNYTLEQKNTYTKQSSNQTNELRLKITQLVQQNDNLKRKVNQISDLNRKNTQYQNKIVLLTQQIERLTRTFENKNIQLTRTSQQLGQFRSQNQKLQMQIYSMHSKLHSSTQSISKMAVYQNRIDILTQQIERLTMIGEQYKVQIHSLNIRLQDLSITQRHKVEAEIKVKRMTEQSQFNRSKYHEYEQKVLQITKQFERLNQIIQQQKGYIAQLKQVNYDLEVKVQHFGTQDQCNIVLGNEIDRLNNVLENKNEQLSQVRLRIADQAAMINRIEQHLALFVVLFAQIESLRKRIKQTQFQVQQVRRSSLLPHRSN